MNKCDLGRKNAAEISVNVWGWESDGCTPRLQPLHGALHFWFTPVFLIKHSWLNKLKMVKVQLLLLDSVAWVCSCLWTVAFSNVGPSGPRKWQQKSRKWFKQGCCAGSTAAREDTHGFCNCFMASHSTGSQGFCQIYLLLASTPRAIGCMQCIWGPLEHNC